MQHKPEGCDLIESSLVSLKRTVELHERRDKLHGMDRINRIVASCMEEVIYLFSLYNQKIVAGKLKEMRENHTKPWNTSLLKYLEIFLRIDEICP